VEALLFFFKKNEKKKVLNNQTTLSFCLSIFCGNANTLKESAGFGMSDFPRERQEELTQI